MTTEQLFLQLGICGAMLLVFWRVAIKWIDRNAEVENQKTAAMAEGFKSLSGKVDTHHMADIQSHSEMAFGIAKIEGMLTERSGVHVVPDLPNPLPRRDTPRDGVRVVREIVRGKTHGDR